MIVIGFISIQMAKKLEQIKKRKKDAIAVRNNIQKLYIFSKKLDKTAIAIQEMKESNEFSDEFINDMFQLINVHHNVAHKLAEKYCKKERQFMAEKKIRTQNLVTQDLRSLFTVANHAVGGKFYRSC